MRKSIKNAARDEPQVRKELVLDESIRIIGERGYYGFTIQELAKRCKLSNAGLLYYFGSKDLLLVGVLEEIERREVEALEPIVQHGTRRGAGPDDVLELFRALVSVGTADPEILRLVNLLRMEAIDPQHPAHETLRARNTAALALYTRALKPHVADPRTKARRVSAMLDGLGQQWIRSRQGFDIVEEWNGVAEDLLPELSKQRASRSVRRVK